MKYSRNTWLSLTKCKHVVPYLVCLDFSHSTKLHLRKKISCTLESKTVWIRIKSLTPTQFHKIFNEKLIFCTLDKKWFSPDFFQTMTPKSPFEISWPLNDSKIQCHFNLCLRIGMLFQIRLTPFSLVANVRNHTTLLAIDSICLPIMHSNSYSIPKSMSHT